MSTENAWPERAKTLSGAPAGDVSDAMRVSPAAAAAMDRQNFAMAMPTLADFNHFVVPAKAFESHSTVATGGQDWVYGHHINAATQNADGTYSVAGRSLNEYQYNNLRDRLGDRREAYERQMDIWRGGAQRKGIL